MNGFAHAHVCGTLGNAPKVSSVGSTTKSIFSLAVNREFFSKKKDEKVAETSWILCELWGKPAEWSAQWQKGDRITVHGDIVENKYEKNGEEKRFLAVRAIYAENATANARFKQNKNKSFRSDGGDMAYEEDNGLPYDDEDSPF